MVVPATLFCTLLIAVSALAHPTSKERLASRLARRDHARTRLSRPKQPTFHPTGNITETEYSNNWAGAVLVAEPVRLDFF